MINKIKYKVVLSNISLIKLIVKCGILGLIEKNKGERWYMYFVIRIDEWFM